MLVRDRGVDAVAVGRRAPLHAALVASRADEGVPKELARLRVEEDVDAALPTEADDVVRAAALAERADVRAGAAEVPLLAVVLGSAPGHRRRLRAARAEPRLVSLDAVGPAHLSGVDVHRDERLEVRARRDARLAEAVRCGGGACRDRWRRVVEVAERPEHETRGLVDRRRRDDRRAGPQTRDAAVVREPVRLPDDLPRLRVDRDEVASERALRERNVLA